MKTFNIFAIIAAIGATASAATLTYEGRLMSAQGTAQSSVTLPAVLNVYTSEDASTPIASGNVTINTDAEGYFATSAQGLELPLEYTTFYLGVTPEGGSEIAPRMRVSPAPFAIRAAQARALEVDGDFKVEGTVQITTLTAATNVTAQSVIATEDLALECGVSGMDTLYTGVIDTGLNGYLSLFRRWSSADIHMELSVGPYGTASDVQEREIEEDGIVVIRAAMDTGDYSSCTLSLYADNGDIKAGNSGASAQIGSHGYRYITMPVRKGRKFKLGLRVQSNSYYRTPTGTADAIFFFAGVQ